jgi:hypothetical protein
VEKLESRKSGSVLLLHFQQINNVNKYFLLCTPFIYYFIVCRRRYSLSRGVLLESENLSVCSRGTKWKVASQQEARGKKRPQT